MLLCALTIPFIIKHLLYGCTFAYPSTNWEILRLFPVWMILNKAMKTFLWEHYGFHFTWAIETAKLLTKCLCHFAGSEFQLLHNLFFFFFRATPVVYGRSQARDWIKTAAASIVIATAIAMRDLSRICDLHHSSQQHLILNHWARPGIEPASSWILCTCLVHWDTTGNLLHILDST